MLLFYGGAQKWRFSSSKGVFYLDEYENWYNDVVVVVSCKAERVFNTGLLLDGARFINSLIDWWVKLIRVCWTVPVYRYHSLVSCRMLQAIVGILFTSAIHFANTYSIRNIVFYYWFAYDIFCGIDWLYTMIYTYSSICGRRGV